MRLDRSSWLARALQPRTTYERRSRHAQRVLTRSPHVDFITAGPRVYANGVLVAVTTDPDAYVFGLMGPATDTLDGFPVGLEVTP